MVSQISVSFEFFPPKAGEAAENFWRTLSKLEAIRPRFVSVTYGAGGTTRDRDDRRALRAQRVDQLLVVARAPVCECYAAGDRSRQQQECQRRR